MSRDTGGMIRTVDLLWGTDSPRGSRGPRPGLSVEKITSAALAIADTEGIGVLSMQRIAKTLGYSTMSIYNYVPSKDQLIELMLDAATPPPPPARDGASWREELEDWVRATWQLYQAHPWVLKVPTLSPPVGPNQLAWFEAALHALSRSGLRGNEVLSLGLHVIGSLRGQAAMAADLTASASERTAGEFEQIVSRVVTEDRFPVLHTVIRRNGISEIGIAQDVLVDLEFGLRLLLDGVEEHVKRHLG
ncbi:TetR/AcrR family transcriptional regulator [Rhizohabitans arisaemae]|uniref:TetR/AcrR family transcriptional regulator n=1 Tax=Rhizohabitans arisaemae TaxID=2720610 RepID=UPI0024B23F78|nr:TetR/AcrR family transcriptional regulator [Rhizohabitans arisaemae]